MSSVVSVCQFCPFCLVLLSFALVFLFSSLASLLLFFLDSSRLVSSRFVSSLLLSWPCLLLSCHLLSLTSSMLNTPETPHPFFLQNQLGGFIVFSLHQWKTKSSRNAGEPMNQNRTLLFHGTKAMHLMWHSIPWFCAGGNSCTLILWNWFGNSILY